MLDSEGPIKLLEIAKSQVDVETGTAGKHIAEAAVTYLKEWNLLELIATMHFETKIQTWENIQDPV